ncbi:MAG: EamA family transporter [Blastocatellia bacterium]
MPSPSENVLSKTRAKKISIWDKEVFKTLFYTSSALVAFAFNSILCRMALGGGEADAAGFTLVRLGSGAVAMTAIMAVSGQKPNPCRAGNWTSAFFLFGYAIAFSFAYLGLSAATGALILFGAVQLTIIGFAIYRGERPGKIEWPGLFLAVGGLVYLVFPGLSAPPLLHSILMSAAGVCWGAYTIRGKSGNSPIGETAGNFVKSVPMIVVAATAFTSQMNLSPRGLLLAVASGAIASGIGYAMWYSALPSISSTRAAILQLLVPLLSAFGGILLLGESFDPRSIAAGSLILGGIAISIYARKSKNQNEIGTKP